jgi:hypothetical protein
MIMDDVETMLANLADIAPEDLLEVHFAKSYPDWLKALQHIKQLPGTSNAPSIYKRHFHASSESWIAVGHALGQRKEIKRLTQFHLTCGYARCADPSGLMAGAHLICSLCCDAGYCSARCQKA